jgi:curved DNA-binding protein CbpA
MIVSDHDGEITYYEELGVAPGASPEQIRDAFRLLVRLLHPDQQTDPQLKEIAETQMRKINRIYAVLSDPQSRRRYDEVFDESFEPPIVLKAPTVDLAQWASRLSWGAAIVVSAALLIWLATDNPPAGQGRAPDPSGVLASTSILSAAPPDPSASPDISPSTRISQLQSDLSAAIVERDAAVHELEKLRGTPQTARSGRFEAPEGQDPRVPLTITELPSAPRTPVVAPANSAASRLERPVSREFTGFWFYAKPALGQKNKNQALYPPEYIEATITEETGAVHGRVHSRFHIVDRPISPDVNFTFTGTSNGSQVNCLWTGMGGAKGEMTLKLTAENFLRIDWNASDLGSQLGLSSGTAVLTRRIE